MLLDGHGIQLASLVNVWIITGPGAVQLFMLDTLFWMSAIVMVNRSCSGRLLWSALYSTKHWVLLPLVASFSHILFQYCFVSCLCGVVLIQFPWHWQYTLDGSVEYSYSPGFHLSGIPSSGWPRLCLGSMLYFLGVTLFYSSDTCLVCSLWLFIL